MTRERLNWDVVMAIARRDIATVLRNRGIRIPLMVAPVIILVVLPVFLVVGRQLLSSAPVPGSIESTPFAGVMQEAERVSASVSADARWAVFVLEVFIAPLYLLVPLVTSTVIAADSFAGERERGTLEPLLHSPTTDQELLLAKIIASWLPAMTVALGGLLMYTVVANGLAWPSLGYVFFPNATWMLLAFWVAPGLAALGLGLMVVVSSRVHSLQAANQIGSMLVLPVLLLVIGQVSGVTLFDVRLVTIIGGVVWALAGLLLAWAGSRFERDRLASRL